MQMSCREVPWEYQEVKAIIRRQQLAAMGGSRAAAQASKSAASLSIAVRQQALHACQWLMRRGLARPESCLACPGRRCL